MEQINTLCGQNDYSWQLRNRWCILLQLGADNLAYLTIGDVKCHVGTHVEIVAALCQPVPNTTTLLWEVVFCIVSHCLNEKYTWCSKGWTGLSHQEHRKGRAVFTRHWINQHVSYTKPWWEMLPAHSTVNFTAVIPQVGIVPLSTALLQKSVVICPHILWHLKLH
jgi:hypothetical protein